MIFNYADVEIQWTTGDNNGGVGGLGGTQAQIGFNAGDGIRFTSIPGSLTSDVLNIDSTTNVNKAGVWIFSTHGETIVITEEGTMSYNYIIFYLLPALSVTSFTYNLNGEKKTIIIIISIIDATLTVLPEIACPGDTVTLTCDLSRATSVLTWTIMYQGGDDLSRVLRSPLNDGSTLMIDNDPGFGIRVTSNGTVSGITSSVLTFPSNTTLNGATVECGTSSDVRVSVTVHIDGELVVYYSHA